MNSGLTGQLDYLVGRRRWGRIRPRGVWAFSGNGGYPRVHIIKDAVIAWSKSGKAVYVASYACKGGDSGVRLLVDVPEDIELCDSCLIADLIKPTVYRLYDAAGELVYVGYSADAIKRSMQHARKSSWWPEIVRAECDFYDTREEAMAAEKALIKRHQPRFNKVNTDGYAGTRPRRLVAA